MKAKLSAFFLPCLLATTATGTSVWASSHEPLLSESLTVKHPGIFVPIVLSSSGANNSFFTSELTITNRGLSEATLSFTYVAAFGGGSGTAVDRLPAGQQRVIPDANRPRS